MRRVLFVLVFVLVTLGLTRPLGAITINLTYVQPGEAFGFSPTQFATNGPGANARGGGNIQDIMDVAANVWENILPGEFTVDIEYGWQNIGGSHDIGRHVGRGVRISNNVTRNKGAWIMFDPGYRNWFLDRTPYDDKEYGSVRENSGTYDGKTINDERRFTNPNTSDAGGMDLLTLAMHEIGHALGLTTSNLADYRYDTKRGVDDGVRIATGLPGAGITVDLHGTHPEGIDTLLMAHLLHDGQRVFPSVLDIATIATVSRYDQVQTSFEALRAATRNPRNEIFKSLVQLPGGGTQQIDLGDIQVLPEPSVATALAALVGVLGVARPRRRVS